MNAFQIKIDTDKFGISLKLSGFSKMRLNLIIPVRLQTNASLKSQSTNADRLYHVGYVWKTPIIFCDFSTMGWEKSFGPPRPTFNICLRQNTHFFFFQDNISSYPLIYLSKSYHDATYVIDTIISGNLQIGKAQS